MKLEGPQVDEIVTEGLVVVHAIEMVRYVCRDTAPE